MRRAGHTESEVAGDPHLPCIEQEIQNADDYACNRQNGCRDVGIDQLAQVMEQKTSLIRLNASLGIEPVLKHS
jgi:hypothetical protein